MNKKGLEAEMLRWVLIAIAGVIVLSFFVNFATQEISTSGKLTSREFAFSLEQQLEAMSVSENSNKIIEMPAETSFGFGCDSITNGDFSLRTRKIISAPSFLNGKNINTWVKDWKFPYRIGDIYYLTNDKTTIVLVYDDSTFSKVNSLDFPESFNVQLVRKNLFRPEQVQMAYSQRDTLNVIFFANYNVDEVFSKINVQNLNVATINMQQNTAKMHARTGETDTFYLDDSMLASLIVGPDNYLCVQNEMLDKLSIISEIYAEKTQLLMAKEKGAICKSLLFQLKDTISLLKDAGTKEALLDYGKMVEEQNRGLLKNGCSTVF